MIGLLVWPVDVSKNTKKDRTQKVTENALPTQTPFPSSHINQILHMEPYPGYLSLFQVLLRSVEKCGSCGGRNFGLPIDLAHRLYNSLLLPHNPWCNFVLDIGARTGQTAEMTRPKMRPVRTVALLTALFCKICYFHRHEFGCLSSTTFCFTSCVAYVYSQLMLSVCPFVCLIITLII